ncbi:adenosylcobinamide-GDP ribazoletransferase [Gordonia sp. NB41Y]|uniref:adenosylcobinamide-GDP ribazoletransferase n=1 Tax=Gordonia sp. NB41Y TaxID=875808 RepID=UPI0006B1BC44|nr:adenosylcobinamide-GDP ribazoletransferase [Gordonia sp. NB41Y]EMP13618.2 cobalamin biosynthesis protein CobS [Gordonia sp. NB41Y]WLP90342.1 adenosylcobinamide-GDP ribazoletransferase [Gordonia sp. NB41Y]
MAVSPRPMAVAFSWLTVVPIPRRLTDGEFDRTLGAGVMATVPVVGAFLGTVAALAAWGLSATDLPGAMVSVLVVILLAVGTRGMHVDGVADTADGLGCYGPPERVTEVMRSGSVGPFGAATVAAILAVDAIGFATLAGAQRWLELGLAVAVGRLAAVVATRWSLSPAHDNGFGALVVGTQKMSVAVWTLLFVVAAALVGGFGAHDWFDTAGAIRAVVVVGVVVAAMWLFTRHCARRMGGITGDVIGAAIELGTTIAVIGLLV